ncbi:S26 family signal peptidase [Halobaculum sp. MBLA0143]|uniref:S26 family signal peptidase n=1 Tax=Halobaculum sp. MBLA0143 TaxID=3079933 RepID=UPI003525C6FE
MTDEEAPRDSGASPSTGSGDGVDGPSSADGTDPGEPTEDTGGADEQPAGDSRGGEHGFGDGAVRGDGDGGIDDGRLDDELADAGIVTRFRESESTPVVLFRETLSSALIVAVVGALLFAVSGIWPPMVAVESGSMEPHMQKGDLVFVTEPGRFAPDAARGTTGIVTYEVGSEAGYSTFGQAGSVIVYRQPGRYGPPIIHRARFHVEAGENWYDRANPDYLPGDSCDEVPNCPAPNAGFVTKGDNNAMYDQVNAIGAPPVRPEWVRGVARIRIPLLGWIRLVFSGAATTTPGPVVDLGLAAAATPTAAPGAVTAPTAGTRAVATTGGAGTVAAAAGVERGPGVCSVSGDAARGTTARVDSERTTVSSGA